MCSKQSEILSQLLFPSCHTLIFILTKLCVLLKQWAFGGPQLRNRHRRREEVPASFESVNRYCCILELVFGTRILFCHSTLFQSWNFPAGIAYNSTGFSILQCLLNDKVIQGIGKIAHNIYSARRCCQNCKKNLLGTKIFNRVKSPFYSKCLKIFLSSYFHLKFEKQRCTEYSQIQNFIILLRCGGIFCVILKCRVGYEPPLLEPPLQLVVVSATQSKNDTGRKGRFAFGSESL